MKQQWRVGAALLALASVAGCGSSSDVGADVHYARAEFGTADRPQTIPAVRAWSPQPGSCAAVLPGRIVVASATLADTAVLLADDLRALRGQAPVIVGSAAVAPGDIQLRLGPADAQLGGEGYELQIGDGVTITAPTPRGVFYGTQTLLQLLRQDAALPCGIARDWPRYPERGLMVDIGRMHFTPQWLAARIRELAWLKMNLLHLHFSDNEGWRIESDTHPEIVSEPHLSKSELAALVALAARYHITVVPEIDMPGHMTAALAPYPEYQLANMFGQREADKLDVANEQARAYARELIDEYLPLFPGPYWHMGADEYFGIVSTPLNYELYPQLQAYAQGKYGSDANHKDAILDFIREIDAFVRARGKTLRVWHDGLGGGSAVDVDNDMIVEVWNDFAGEQPPDLLGRGFRILNAGWFPTYYTQSAYSLVRPDMKSAYESWNVNRFHGPFVLNDPIGLPPTVIDADEPDNLGAKLHVWSDVPQLEDEDGVADGIYPRLRVIAQKTWNSDVVVVGYDGFVTLIDRVGAPP